MFKMTEPLRRTLGALLPSLFAGQVALAPVALAADLPDVVRATRVVATIRHNETMGDFVAFGFPINPYDCDRAEIFEFINSADIGGATFQGGGAPGAPILATFRAAKTRDDLRRVIQRITPKLDALMRDIANGVPIPKPAPRKIVDKRGKEWPECVPPDPDDPLSAFNNNLNVNGTEYYCSAEGRWVVNDKAMKQMRAYQLQRASFVAALTVRKFTHEELMRLDSRMNIRDMESYNAAVKFAELYDLLVAQWEIQTGTTLPIKTHLSRAIGEYGRSPQEGDNRRAVETMIATLQALPEHD